MQASRAPFIVACLQMCSTKDLETNREVVINAIRQAAEAGAVYIQTPEMTSLVVRDRKELFEKVTDQFHDPLLSAACEAARDCQITVHLGSLPVRSQEQDRLANRSFVINAQGEIISTYDKIHLFDVTLASGETWQESLTYTAGQEAVVAPLRVNEETYKLGLSICYDLRFPHLYRTQAEAGAEILTVPSCFTYETGQAHWQVLQRARAIENGCFVISAAQGGLHEDGRYTYGHSIIVDPWGNIIVEAADESGLLLAKIDPALVEQARSQIPSLKHTRLFSMCDIAGNPGENL